MPRDVAQQTRIVFPDKTYRRSGDCDGCRRPGLTPGQCCTYLKLPLARELTPDEKHWVELHPGVRIVGQNVQIDIKCSALEDGRCTLFGKSERPELCSRYPEHPDLDMGCSYTFEKVSGDGGSTKPR